MSKALASEDSPYERFLASVSESLFGVIYTVQKTRKEDLVRLNILTGLASILLDFVQILPFFVHGYNWGNITLTWGRYVRYVQLQLQLTTWDSFNVAFWASVAIVALVGMLTGNVFYSLYNKNTPHPVGSALLALAYNVVLHILFVAGFKLLMTPWWCNPVTKKLFPFESVACFSGPNVINLIVGSIFTVILLVMVVLGSLATVNLAPVPNDLFAVTTPSYRIAFYFVLVFMTINENLIAKLIGEPGNGDQTGIWWEALLNWIVMTLFFAVLVYYLPYQVPEGNLWRGGLVAAAWWVSACCFVAVNYGPNTNAENHVIDYITLGGLLPAFALGYYIISTRYLVFKSLAVSLLQEIEEDFQSNELYTAKFGSKRDDVIVGGHRNPYIYLPEVLQKFGADVTTIEITGRLLWHNSSAKENVEASYRLYRRAEQAYPDLAYVKFLRANCLTYLSPDPTAFIDQIEGVKKLNPGFLVQFLIYKRDMETKYRGSINKGEGGSASDMISHLEFQKYYAEAQKYNQSAITAIRNFWELFLNSSITFSGFNKAARAIELHSQKALTTYKTLIIRYPKHIYIISSYAYFLELVLHNAEEAERYHRRADQLQARENDDTGLTEGGVDSQAVLTISEDGIIEQVNNATTKLFGWSRADLLTRSIKLIVPSPYKERHDQFLDRYRTTGMTKVVGAPPRKIFGQHKDGYSFAITLQIAETRKDNGNRAFVGCLVPTDLEAEHGVIMINEEGVIVMVSKKVTQMFGYSAVELLRNNITICMIDAYAANHETYLKRYKDTGEARLIGSAGRNVPARRKDASVFPISLTVEEEYVAGDRFYIAHILDTSSIAAIIYMDGMGIVQNCDSGISALLGYRREDLIGQNIKTIMPPPYNQFHDMYLERYRRTKISNILRLQDGRVLQALHADGSVVKIRAFIQKSDTGDGSDNLLFKGIIKRVNTDAQDAVGGRVGFDSKSVIEMKKDGTIISVAKSILNTLGYPAEKDPKDFVGQAIEVLIPPVENRPPQQRSYWMAQALAAQDLNFYILLLNKNFTLFPFTYNLSMKSEDVVLMRLRDILTTDALLTIDELGTILSSNEDAFLLLGHDSDEIVGRNIKYIQDQEVASQHDSYLARYKETKVARVVGTARHIKTIHRDKSVLPIEILVSERKTPDGNHFIGRMCHLPLEERVSHEFVESFYRTVAEDNENQNLTEEKCASEDALKDPFEVEDQVDDDQDASEAEEEDSEEDSDLSSSEEDEDYVAEISADMEGKLLKLKGNENELTSTRRLGYVIYCTFALLTSALIAGLIAGNLGPTPEPLYIFLDELSLQANIINRAIFALRLARIQEEAPLLIQNITNTPGSEDYWECSLGAAYNYTKGGVTKEVPICAFIQKFNIKEDLDKMVANVVKSQNWFTKNYPIIRKPGDALDVAFNAKLSFQSFENGLTGASTLRNFASWTDFISSGFFDAISRVADNPVFDGSHLSSRLHFQFIQANRKLVLDRMAEIQEAVFVKIADLLAMEALIHLVILLIIIVTVGVSFGIFMIPIIRSVMADRLVILKLLLLVPKHVIYDFVFTIYRDDAEDEQMGGERGNEEKLKEEAKAKAMAIKSEEVVDIVNDNVYQLYIFFGTGLASIVLPVLVHVIWRYGFNTSYQNEVNSYYDASFLYTMANSLLWRATGLLAPCSFRVASDQQFCLKMNDSSAELKEATTKADAYLKSLKNRFAGNPKVDSYFYNPEILKEVYKGCMEKSTIKMKVDRAAYPQYSEFPANLQDGETFTVQESAYRCTDTYVSEPYYPHEIKLPKDYAVHYTRGIANTLSLLFQSSFSLAETSGYNVTTAPSGPVSAYYYFNIFEATEREAIEGIKYFEDVLKAVLLEKYATSRTAFNATYIVTLIYVIILFGWVFDSTRRDLVSELKHNRGIIFMIPTSVSAKSKPIVEYVEKVLSELIK